ncbi:MAG TPA: 4Fe-4S binding protein [Acidobacteriota bacterium]|nr:4Fe-4S binding protein [Acidobacteriota bacterium]
MALQRPVVDPARCIGCGLCENKCPVFDQRAIRVSSVGESRSDTNVLVLE